MRLKILSQTLVLYKSTIQRLVKLFRETGSIGEKRRSGRPSVISNDSLEDIRARLLQSPRKSLRKLSQHSGMRFGFVQRATKVSNCIHTEFKSVMNLNKLIKRKGCFTADGSDNLYEIV
jgi:transposase